MQPSTTFTTKTQLLLWLLIFLGSVLAVITLRRQLTADQGMTTIVQRVSVKLLHTAAQTRLMLP